MRFAKLISAIATLLMTLTPPLYAQETIIRVGTAGNITATNSLTGNTRTESLSTAQVDSVLRLVAPSTFGQNFTRDKANKVFADFSNFKIGIGTSLKQAIEASDSSLRVDSAIIGANAINMRLSQKTNVVVGQLGTFSVIVRGKKRVGVPLICPSADFSFSIDNAMVSGDYNYISGDVSNVNTTYQITNVKTDCNGFGLWNLLANLVNDITGFGNNQVRNAIQSAANSAVTFANMKQLFSLADFANGLNYFRNETPVTAVANQAISLFKELVNDAAINTPGIVLDFGIEFASAANPANAINIFASSAPVDVELPGQFRYGEPIEGNLVSSIQQPVDLYYSQSGSNWIYAGSTVTGSPQLPIIPNGAKLIAIGRNPTIPGLESFPGKAAIFSIVQCSRRCIVS